MALLNKKHKDDYFSQAMEVEHTPVAKSSLSRKREKILRTYNDPVLPKASRIVFWSMIVITVFMIAAEIVNFTRYDGFSGPDRLFKNLTLTGLVIWTIYAIAITAMALIGMHIQKNNYYKKLADSNIELNTAAEKTRSMKAVIRLNSVYKRYLIVCLAGILIWLLTFFAVRIIFGF